MENQSKLFQKNYQDLLDSMPDGIVVVNSVGDIVFFNSQATKIFGYNTDEVLGEKIEILIPERYREIHPSHRIKYTKNTSVREMGANLDLYGLAKDQSEFPVEVSLSPVRLNNEQFIISAVRDITQRVKFEQSRREELEELTRKANEANRLKNQFLANISHELRTPLHGILGFSELLKQKTDDKYGEEEREYIDLIHQSGNHLLTLINKILNVIKLNAGKEELLIESFILEDVIQEVLSTLNSLSRKKKIDIVTETNGITSVRLDRIKVKQILYNLVSNAIKFSNPDSTIEVTAKISDGKSLTLTVKDYGIGIEKDKIAEIFQEFSATGKYADQKSIGLGLPISKKLVDLFEGSITVDSTPGVGSVFTIKLPLKQEE